LSIAEAMAAGAAVVATQTEGASEIVEDQTTGLLVPIGNVEQMAEAMLRLLGDEQRRKAMGEKAITHVRERFGLRRMVDDIEKIYLEP